MRKTCKLIRSLSLIVLLSAAANAQIVLGPRYGVRIGPRGFGIDTEEEYRLTEVPITTGNSGRINAIAINPTTRREILVTSESGGLFKSTNDGTSWRHVDDLPPHETRDVAYVPGDSSHPQVVLVTAFDDFRIPSGAGIWRLVDGRWQQPSSSILPTSDRRCASRASGFGIAVEPDTNNIYVATSCGILKSSDRGETWSRIDRSRRGGTGDWSSLAFYAILALGDSKVIAAGRSGIWYSEDGGANWARSTFPTSGEGLYQEEGYHALSASPASLSQAYLVTGPYYLPCSDNPEDVCLDFRPFYSNDSGRNWVRIPTLPSNVRAGSGGNPFIKVSAVTDSGDLDLYFSDSFKVQKRRARRLPGTTPTFDFTDPWTVLNANHADTRDIVIQGGVPLFLADDGGLEKWHEADSRFRFIGGGRSGLNAWQLSSVTGQRFESTLEHHLYIGSHDNGMRASADFGFSWPYCGGLEGGTIQVDRRVRRISDSLLYWSVAFLNPGKRLGGPLFGGDRDCSAALSTVWPSPTDRVGNPILDASGTPTVLNGEPLLIKHGVYLQGRDSGMTIEEWKATKRDGGWDWDGPLSLVYHPFGPFSVAGGADNPVVYLPSYRSDDPDGNAIFLLTRLSNLFAGEFRSSTVEVAEPPTTPGLRGLGVNLTHQLSFAPFGVESEHPNHLIAPDAIAGEMKESFDGGDSWTPMPELTALVTNGGALRFSRPNGVSETSRPSGLLLTQVSAISFCPDYSQFVLLGTHEGGLYLSKNYGMREGWFKIPHSDQIKSVSGFYWESPTSVYIATNGRGLWHLGIGVRTTVEPGELELVEFCPSPCFLDLLAGPKSDTRPLDIDEALLAMGGSIHDAVVEKGVLKSFAVSPGAVAISFVSKQTSRAKLVPTHTNRIGQFAGLSRAAELIRKQKVIRGFTLKNGLIKHVIYGDTIIKLELPPRSSSKIKPVQTSAVDNRPYISVTSEEMSGGLPTLHGPGELKVSGRNFAAGNTPIEIRIDDQISAQGVVVDQQGRFSVTIKSTAGMGWHRIQVSQRLTTGKQLRDGRTFLVRPLDR